MTAGSTHHVGEQVERTRRDGQYPIRTAFRTWVRLAFALCAATLLISLTPSSNAADPVPEAASLSEEGYAAYLQGNYEQAAERFAAAIAIDPHPILRFNRGRALEELERLPSALALYRGVVEDADSERVVGAARARATALVERLLNEGYDPNTVTDATYKPPVTITLELAVADAQLYLDGRSVELDSEGRLLVRAGAHQLFVSAEGYYPYRATIEADEGEIFAIELQERVALSSYVPPAPGRLSVFGPTAGMAIYLRGSRLDRLTPLSDYILAEGEYDITLRHPFYEDFTARVVIEAGQETVINANPAEREDLRRSRNGRQRAGNALLVSSAALIGVGAGLGGSALRWSNVYNDEPLRVDRDEVFERAQRQGRSADAILISAAAVGLVGIILRAIPQPAPETSVEDYDDSLLRLEFPDEQPAELRF